MRDGCPSGICAGPGVAQPRPPVFESAARDVPIVRQQVCAPASAQLQVARGFNFSIQPSGLRPVHVQSSRSTASQTGAAGHHPVTRPPATTSTWLPRRRHGPPAGLFFALCHASLSNAGQHLEFVQFAPGSPLPEKQDPVPSHQQLTKLGTQAEPAQLATC